MIVTAGIKVIELESGTPADLPILVVGEVNQGPCVFIRGRMAEGSPEIYIGNGVGFQVSTGTEIMVEHSSIIKSGGSGIYQGIVKVLLHIVDHIHVVLCVTKEILDKEGFAVVGCMIQVEARS